jgi:hypothetical protein
LVNSLRNLSTDASKLIRINDAGTGFKLDSIADLITAINASSELINAQKIDGDTIEDFITAVGTELNAHIHSNKTVLDGITTELINAWSAKQNALGFTPEDSANKGVANGYASLGSDVLIPVGQLPPAVKESVVVDDMDARDALDAYTGLFALVIDSDDVETDDQTALYVCTDDDPVTWALVSLIDNNEYSLDWNNITDKPDSDVEDIDAAVTNAHTHSNKTSVLDKFSLSGGDDLMFDGSLIVLGSSHLGELVSEILTASSDNVTDLILGAGFDEAGNEEDILLGVDYAGVKLAAGTDYTFDQATKTISLDWPLLNTEWIEAEYEKFSQAAV